MTDWTREDLNPTSPKFRSIADMFVRVPDMDDDFRISHLAMMNSVVDLIARDLGIDYDEFMGMLIATANQMREDGDEYSDDESECDCAECSAHLN